MQTAAGKTTASRLAEPLVGKDVHIITYIQSGQALVELIGGDPVAKGGQFSDQVQGVPTLLRPAEFSALLKSAGASQSILLPKLCELYDANDAFELGRVKSHGAVTVVEPTANLFTLCPVEVLGKLLTQEHVGSGLMNRFLILLGTGEEIGPFAPPYDGGKVAALAQKLDSELAGVTLA